MGGGPGVILRLVPVCCSGGCCSSVSDEEDGEVGDLWGRSFLLLFLDLALVFDFPFFRCWVIVDVLDTVGLLIAVWSRKLSADTLF